MLTIGQCRRGPPFLYALDREFFPVPDLRFVRFKEGKAHWRRVCDLLGHF
jgi:hypothetical protein